MLTDVLTRLGMKVGEDLPENLFEDLLADHTADLFVRKVAGGGQGTEEDAVLGVIAAIREFHQNPAAGEDTENMGEITKWT